MNKKKLEAGVGYTIGNLFLRGMMFFTLPIFTRILSPADLGLVNVFSSYESMLFVFVGLAIHVSIKNAKFDMGERYRNYLTNCVYLVLVNTGIAFTLYNLLIWIFPHFLGFTYIQGICLIIYSMSTSLTLIYNTKIGLEYEYKQYLIISYISSIINIGFSLIFLYTFLKNDKVTARILGMTFGSLIPSIYAIFSLLKNNLCRWNFSFLKYGLKISLPVIPHSIAQTILSSFDRIMIKEMVSATNAGIYSVAYTLSSIPQVIISSLNAVWEPGFFEYLQDKRYNELKRDIINYAVVITLVFMLFALISPEVIEIIATEQYSDARDISVIIIAGAYFSSMYILPCEFEYYYKKTKYLAVFTSIAGLINIVLNYIFIPMLGYKAAAYTTMVSYVVYFLLHLISAFWIQENDIIDLRKLLYIEVAFFLFIIMCILLLDKIFIRYLLFVILIGCATIYFLKRKRFEK